MKSTKGKIIGKVPPASMHNLLESGKDTLYRIKYLLNMWYGGKWDNEMGDWEITLPVENLRGWMMVDYVISTEKDYKKICELYDKAFKYSQGEKIEGNPRNEEH